MKKLLSFLSTISLSTITSTNIIACQQPNTNNNNQPTTPHFAPQQPPTNSNWKLIEDKFNDFWELKPNNKWYILLLKNYVSNNWNIMKINLTINPRHIEFEPKQLLEAVYRWDGINEPTTPTINKNTGKITNWNK